MIRVNLIAGEQRTTKVAGRTLAVGQKATIIGTLMLMLTAVAVGWRFQANAQAEEQVAIDIDDARREEARLSEVLKQLAELEAQRTEHQQRVALIDELRRGQSAPVHMIDQISRSLPEMTWLTSIKQDAYNVTIEGRCMALTALSDFVGNLEATKYFKKPVEIIESEVVSGQKDGPDLIQFTIKGAFQMAGIDVEDPAGKPAKKGKNIG